MQVKIEPLTPERWDDFAELFGPRGACAGCWCMWWRLKRSDWEKKKGAGNRRAMRSIVKRGEVPGLIAYVKGDPVGWVSVAPRERFPVLERSRILKPVDDKPAWSVVCLFVRRDYRNRGLSVKLLNAAARYAKRHGGRIVEGYPVEPRKDRMPDAFAFTGIASAYVSAGFTECARRSETRPIMRKRV